jgi:hypothetical protein
MGMALLTVATMAGAFLISWRRRRQKPPTPIHPYREWND